jgi:HSP20 family protein
MQKRIINPTSINSIITDLFKGVDNTFPLQKDYDYSSKVFTPASSATLDDRYHLSIESPGVTKKDLNIEIDEGVLSISGEKKSSVEGERGIKEIVYGAFTRKFTLPEDADIDNIKADYRNGVLEINIPRKEPEKTSRTISIS